MTSPEIFYNEYIKDLKIKPSLKTMILLTQALREYRDLITGELQKEQIERICGKKLKEQWFEKEKKQSGKKRFINKTIKEYKTLGIYISIIFKRNPNREEQWEFVIENKEDCLFRSDVYGSYWKAKTEAALKANEILTKEINF